MVFLVCPLPPSSTLVVLVRDFLRAVPKIGLENSLLPLIRCRMPNVSPLTKVLFQSKRRSSPLEENLTDIPKNGGGQRRDILLSHMPFMTAFLLNSIPKFVMRFALFLLLCPASNLKNNLLLIFIMTMAFTSLVRIRPIPKEKRNAGPTKVSVIISTNYALVECGIFSQAIKQCD